VKRAGAAILVAAALLASPRAARAEPPHDLHFNTAIDLPITLVLFGGYQVSELVLKKRLAPAKAGWRERAPDGADRLNFFDRAGRGLRWVDAREAARVSDFLLIMANITSQSLTYVASTIDGDSGVHGAENVLMIFEATSIAAATNQLTKFIVGRQRPCSRFALAGATAPCFGDPIDENLSFFSGHAAVTAALATSSGMVASLRGYALAPLVWGTGALVALTTGGLRVAADKHFLSDVLGGIVIGGTIGALVPLLAHRRVDSASPAIGAAPPLGGASFGYAGVF
jgi:membrane-associated phospholipid phosphatase